jgi:hypothetical protein
VGSTGFVVYLKGIIGTLLPKKVPKQKNLPIAEKMVPCWQRSRDLCQQGKKMGDQ